jgi:hypothetical protein
VAGLAPPSWQAKLVHESALRPAELAVIIALVVIVALFAIA